MRDTQSDNDRFGAQEMKKLLHFCAENKSLFVFVHQ